MSAPGDGRRLLVFVTHPSRGGAAAFADWLGELLRERGHDVRLVYLYGDGRTHDRPCLLAGRPRGPFDGLLLLLRSWRLIRRFRPHAVHGVMPLACVVGCAAGLLAGCPSRVAGQHQTASYLQPVLKRLDGWCGATGVYTRNVACSRTTLDGIAPPGSRYRRRSTVIYNVVRTVDGVPDRRTTRERFALPVDAFIVGSVGELSSRKNQLLLVELLADLEAAHLVLVGDGDAAEEIRDRAHELDVADRCHLLGQLPPTDVPALLAAFDVFAFPSRGEAFPLAVLEAMRAGTAIVASDLGMNVEALAGRDGTTAGILVPITEPARWRVTLRALQLDPARRNALGAAAVARFARFSADAMARAYEQAFFHPAVGQDELYTV